MTISSTLNSKRIELAVKYQNKLYAERDEILSSGGSLQDFLNSNVYRKCIREITRLQGAQAAR